MQRSQDTPVPVGEAVSCRDVRHDTFDTYADVFGAWPFVVVRVHGLLGRVLVPGHISATNRNGELVRRTCAVDGRPFREIDAVATYERRGPGDATFRIKVLALPRAPSSCKFWTHVDDPSRPKGTRDVKELYRYLELSLDGVREIDIETYDSIRRTPVREKSTLAGRLLTECQRPLRRDAGEVFWEILEELAASYDHSRFRAIGILGRALALLGPVIERDPSTGRATPVEIEALGLDIEPSLERVRDSSTLRTVCNSTSGDDRPHRRQDATQSTKASITGDQDAGHDGH